MRDLAGLEQEAEAPAVDAGVVAGDGKVAHAGGAESKDESLGDSAEAEAADGEEHAVAGESCERLFRAGIKLIHAISTAPHYAPAAAGMANRRGVTLAALCRATDIVVECTSRHSYSVRLREIRREHLMVVERLRGVTEEPQPGSRMKRSLFLQILVRAAVACAFLCAALLLTRDLWAVVLAAADGFVWCWLRASCGSHGRTSRALEAAVSALGEGREIQLQPAFSEHDRLGGDDPHRRRRVAAQLRGERRAARKAGGAAGLHAGCGYVDRFVGAHHLGEQGDAAAGGGLVRLGARGLLAGADDSRAGGAGLRACGARDEEVFASGSRFRWRRAERLR